ncbi:MAG TPA: cell division protein ZipA C-terminal FtsZ-binding domain-containing protein, partial [Nevskiaceae bacterium]|nr:cell division protein ZipA C-terminal FtsZ-binding domain-containing protein [Nevskiaceae bacterium]
SLGPAPTAAPSAGGGAKTPSLGAGDAKVVALIVAPTEETDILGPQLHSALQAQGLKFGEGEVYHRMIGGRIVYSVAGLIKPGKLIPAEAADFSTRGLTVVLQLPGPVQGDVAFDDMATTTRALAAALKAAVFDMRRQPLTDDIAAGLRADVADWVRNRA